MPSLTWSNPIIDAYLADPFILRAEGRWWLIATGGARDGRQLPIWSSADLVCWEFVAGAVEPGPPGAWNRRNFWAPEVLVHDGRYWLYYTASPDGTPENTGNRVGLAVAERPAGPYRDLGVLVDHASLDGSPFRDADGGLWLLYVIEHGSSRGLTAGTIWADRLASPDRLADRAVLVMGRHPWQEGPALLRCPDQRLILSYSVGSWGDGTYRVQQAVGERPDGAFAELPGSLMRSTPAVQGPGHHAFFPGPDGRPWLVYHGWDPGMGKRYPRIDRLVFDGGTLAAPACPSSGPQSWNW